MFSRAGIPVLFFHFCLVAGFAAQPVSNRYALILEDAPLAAKFESKGTARSAAAGSYRNQVAARQQNVRTELSAKHIEVAGSVNTLLNAVFVVASKDRAAELQAIPGVKAVVPLRRYERKLNRAAPLLNAPAAWSALGGVENAGRGIKIAILDSGIDQSHPAFHDESLPLPPGYPICAPADCSFTNNKVIVARSYVRQLAAGSSPNPAVDSRPDDYSPRDRDGHGTAVASCAAANNGAGPLQISGMAPKAYLGNYKIYGSPAVNDSTTDDVIIQAMEDALNDGMDVVSFSSGGPAFSGPLDTGAACGLPAGVACDLVAQAFDTAAAQGLIIVAAAGNEGQDGMNSPTFGSIASPADAPHVIAVGATTNSHFFAVNVSVSGQDVPPGLQHIAAQLGNGNIPNGAVTAPLRDVTVTGDNGLACAALPNGSMAGAIALIQRGTCNFSDKLLNAENAGAVGVIFYMADASAIIAPGGLSGVGIPAVMVSNADGLALKSFIAANPNHAVAIDPNSVESNSTTYNRLAGFSSLGPSLGDGVKPDLVAVGTSLYMAAQSYDPLGALYSGNGYAVADGTSFSAPLVAGAAALVKQSRPAFTAAQVRSALVNTTSQDVAVDDAGRTVGVRSVGAGKLDAGAAVNATVTVDPPTVSFGVLKTALPEPKQLTITNTGTNGVELTVASSGSPIMLSAQTISLGPAGSANASATLTVSLSGAVPAAGAYSGSLLLQGPGVSLHVPYSYLVGSGIPANLIPLTGDFFDGTVSENIPAGISSFRVVDTYGVPVANAVVRWTAQGGTLRNAELTTDAFGVAAAQPVLGSQPGNYSYTASIVTTSLSHTFSGTARLKPQIQANGIVNAADYRATICPGSYVSIFGSSLSDFTDATRTAALPLAINYVHVSFDVPSAGISVPGRLIFVSPGQINVQVPWELQGQSAVQVKVTINYSPGNVVTLQLSDYAPAFYEIGAGVVAALDTAYKPIGTGNPARRGDATQLFANGLGPVDNQPATGDPAGVDPLVRTKGAPPVVMIGGKPAAVEFSGLAPGFPGLYQVNVRVPDTLTAGNHPITIAIGGKTSKPSGLSVQ